MEFALSGLGLLLLIFVVFGRRGEIDQNAAGEHHDQVGRLSLASTCLLLLLVAASNLLINPIGLYPISDFTHVVVLRSRHDKVSLYRKQVPAPEVLILGSSRSFTLSPQTVEALTGLTAFNASVQAGSPRDYLAFLRLTLDRGSPPKITIINLSVEQLLFHSYEGQVEPGEPLGAYLSGPAPALRNTLHAAELLLSGEQTEASLRALRALSSDSAPPYYSFDADGDGHFNINPPLDQAVREYLAGPWAPSMFDFVQLDDTQTEYLRSFLDLARSNDITVIIFLPPFQPDAVERYNSESPYPQRQIDMMELLDDLSSQYRFAVYDFRDVKSFGGSPEMFHDAVHPLKSAYDLMIENALSVETSQR